MGMRITTGMMMNTYRYNLQQTTSGLDSSREKVLTQRKFNSYAEDPAAATHAWRVRRSLTQNAGYQVNNTETYTRFNAAWITMGSIDNNLLNGDGGALAAIKRADNDPTGGARNALGEVLSNLAESLIFSMNGAKYGDHYLFSGNDEMNAPFSWDGDKLLYRGINVDAGTLPTPDSMPPDWGDMIPADTPRLKGGETSLENAWIAYYRSGEPNPLNYEPEWLEAYQQYQKDLADYDATHQDGDGMVKPTPPTLPEELSDLDEAWLDYLNTPDTATDPTKEELNPKNVDNAPEWSDIANPDVAKVPEGMPKDRGQCTTTWEKVWFDYYTDLAAANEELAKLDPNDPNYDNDVAAIEWPTDPRTVNPEEEYKEWYPAFLEDPANAKLPKVGDPDYPDTEIGVAWLEYAYDQRDAAKLKALSLEEKNVDLGMGLAEASERELIQATAFNRSLPGINMLGFGADEDGDPKNIVSIMKRLGEIYTNCDSETGEFATNAEREEAYRLLDKFNAAHTEFNKSYSEIDTKAEFLTANGTRLSDQGYNLKEQIAELEQVDLADAINDFSWAYYCYSSALKVGTQLLSQSLIDYMS